MKWYIEHSSSGKEYEQSVVTTSVHLNIHAGDNYLSPALATLCSLFGASQFSHGAFHSQFKGGIL